VLKHGRNPSKTGSGEMIRGYPMVDRRTRSAFPESSFFPSEKPALPGDAKVKKPHIPDGSRNGENVTGKLLWLSATL
jgi:hypothetical protein